MQSLTSLMSLMPILIQAAGIATTIVEVSTASQSKDVATSAAKKAQAIAQAKLLLANVKLPDFLTGNLDAILGLLVDGAVATYNGSGFFKKA